MAKFINEDHKKGLSHILTESRKVGKNIKEVNWVLPVSKILAMNNICYPFWRAVVSQNSIDRVYNCHSFYDIAYGEAVFLFSWSNTREGHNFWEKRIRDLISQYPKKFWEYGWE